jgi:hypothetical protein
MPSRACLPPSPRAPDSVKRLNRGVVAGSLEPKVATGEFMTRTALAVIAGAVVVGYVNDRGLTTDAAGRVRADLGFPPPSAPQVTLDD